MIAQATAAKLLDDVLYSRVIECIDLSKLMLIELDLWAALAEQVPDAELSEGTVRQEAKAMIDRALARFASADDRYAVLQPFGMDCPDCDDEIAESRRGRH